MKTAKRIITVCVSLCFVLSLYLVEMARAESSTPPSGPRKFKSAGSPMKNRKKDKSAFSKRKHFGQKQKKSPKKTSTQPVMP
jgi:uncharacterized MAPEG superfamily protein